ENFRPIEDRVVQRDREYTEAELFRALEQLVRRVIDHILRIVERVNMKVDLDPVSVTLTHAFAFALALTLDHEHEQEQEKSRTKRLRGVIGYLLFTDHDSRAQSSGGGMADTYV